MKTLVMTVMALMVATVAVAEDKPPVWTEELEITCPLDGSDKDGFDVIAENKKTNAWKCTVTVETNSPKVGSPTYSGVVRDYVGKHNLGGMAGVMKGLQCKVIKQSCELSK